MTHQQRWRDKQKLLNRCTICGGTQDVINGKCEKCAFKASIWRRKRYERLRK